MAQRQSATLNDLQTLRTAQEHSTSKIAHDVRELRERIDRAPQLAQAHLERFALDLDGARSEIATLRANTTKMRDELAANTGAMRTDLAGVLEALRTLREEYEKFTPSFDKFDQRLATGLTRIASQVADSETGIGDSLLNARGQLAALRGDIAETVAKETGDISDQVGAIRAEFRAGLRSNQSLFAAAQIENTTQILNLIRNDSARVLREIDDISDTQLIHWNWIRRARWWQWRYWRRRSEPEEEAPTDESTP